MELSLLLGITFLAAFIFLITLLLCMDNTMTANLRGYPSSFIPSLGTIIPGIVCVIGFILLIAANMSMKNITPIETIQTERLIKEDPSDSCYVTRNLSRDFFKDTISYAFLTENEDGEIAYHDIEDAAYNASIDGTTAQIIETECDNPFVECHTLQSKWLFLRKTEQRYYLHVSDDQIKTVASSDGETKDEWL